MIFHSQDADLAEGGLAHEGPTASFLGLAGIPETAETVALARDLLLGEQSGVRAHFSQITSARGAELIANAQARGLPVTADVALYQLILTDEALIDFSSLYHVQPPLRSRADRDGLREAVKAGVISAIASHHQPHERDACLLYTSFRHPHRGAPDGLHCQQARVKSLTQVAAWRLQLAGAHRYPADCAPFERRPYTLSLIHS